MGLLSKTSTKKEVINSPIVGETYDYKTKYGNGVHEKEPLNIAMTQTMLQNHADGAKNIPNMKSLQSKLRTIHDTPLLKKVYGNWQVFQNKIRYLDINKIKLEYPNVEKYSDDLSSMLVDEYVEFMTDNEFHSYDEIMTDIADKLLGRVKEDDSFYPYSYLKDPRTQFINKESYMKKVDTNDLVYFYSIYWDFNSDEKFVKFSGFAEYVTDYQNDKTGLKPFNKSIEVSKKIKNLLSLSSTETTVVLKLTTGEYIELHDNLDRFYTEHDKLEKISSPCHMMVTTQISKPHMSNLYPKDEKRLRLARERLGYQEQKNKKRNRQDKLYETLMNEDFDFDVIEAYTRMYLDFYMFKDPKFRNDRNWQLYLKGIMRYFCRIGGIAEQSSGSSSFTFQMRRIEIQKETIKGQCPEIKDRCKLTKGRVKSMTYNKYQKGMKANYVLLSLCCPLDENTHIKYTINFSKLYEIDNGSNGYLSSKANLAVSSDVWKVHEEVLARGYTQKEESIMPFCKYLNAIIQQDIIEKATKAKKYADLSPSEHAILRQLGFMLIEYATSDDPDYVHIPGTEKIGLFSIETINEICLKEGEVLNNGHVTPNSNLAKAFAEGSVITSSSASRLLKQYQVGQDWWWSAEDKKVNEIDGKTISMIMPLNCWNMIPYCAKLRAYTCCLLLTMCIEYEVEEATWLGELLNPLIAVVGIVVSIFFPPAGIAAGSFAHGMLAVGSMISAAGTMSGGALPVLNIIGTVLTVGAGITATFNATTPLSTMDKILTASKALEGVTSLANNLYSTNMQQNIASIAGETASINEQSKKEAMDRAMETDGVHKTSASSDEEIDEMFELTSTEMLMRIIENTVEGDQKIYREDKYDNTRKSTL